MFHATNHDAIITAGVDSVGTVPVSMLTYASIVSLHPDLIINAGTAGGFQVSRCYLHCQTLCGWMFWSSVLEIVFKHKGGSVILMHLALVGGLHCKDASYCLETYMIWGLWHIDCNWCTHWYSWAWQSKGAAIGDVFVATQFANHDRRIPVPVCIDYSESSPCHFLSMDSACWW